MPRYIQFSAPPWTAKEDEHAVLVIDAGENEVCRTPPGSIDGLDAQNISLVIQAPVLFEALAHIRNLSTDRDKASDLFDRILQIADEALAPLEDPEFKKWEGGD